MNKVSKVAVLSVLIETYIWIWELHKIQLKWGGGMGPPATIYSNRTHCRVGSRPSRTTVWMWLQCVFVLLSHPMPSTRRVTIRHQPSHFQWMYYISILSAAHKLLSKLFNERRPTQLYSGGHSFKHRIGDTLSWGSATSSSVLPGKCRDAVSS